VEAKVYIIILNYKGWKDTIECLESVLKLNNPIFQIIVIDNSPTLESIENIEGWANGKDVLEITTFFPKIIYPIIPKPIDYRIISEEESKKHFFEEQLLLIRANDNLGFSAGNNIGLNYALKRNDFDYCWLLNNDTVVEKDSLRNQIQYLKNHSTSKIGILGSKLLCYFDPDKIQAIGGSFNSNLFVSKQIGEGLKADTKKDAFKSIDYVIGASMLVSKAFLKEVGTLSEDYFLYYEELDWAYRCKEKGWKMDWCPQSIIYHKEGGTIGTSSNPRKRSFISEINVFKSRKTFFKKFFKNSYMFWVSSLLIIINRVRRFQFKLAFNFFKILIAKR